MGSSLIAYILSPSEGNATTVTVWTISHSTHSATDFLDLLHRHRIGLVADVRSQPGSRRYPWFDRECLQHRLPDVGIAYRHFSLPGGRRRPVLDSPNDVWRHPVFRAYADYMAIPKFTEGLTRLTKAADRQRTALMCTEGLWWRCHRRLISDTLFLTGWRILHILPDGRPQFLPFPRTARIIWGRLNYALPHLFDP